MNAGAVKTDILRSAPWFMRAGANVVRPFHFDSAERSAHNVVEACQRDDWLSATYWGKTGNFEKRTAIVLDESTTHDVMALSRDLTGV